MIRLTANENCENFYDEWMNCPDFQFNENDILVCGGYCQEHTDTLAFLLFVEVMNDCSVMLNLENMRIDVNDGEDWMVGPDLTYDGERLTFGLYPDFEDAINSYVNQYFVVEEF